MVHFPACSPCMLCVHMQVDVIQTSGLPHSDIRGSSDIGSYPRLFAASHVLLRLAAPRHPPWTLIRLTILFISSLRYKCKNQMGQIRLELMTPALSERCSNQLSYCPRQRKSQRYRRREGFKSMKAICFGRSFTFRTNGPSLSARVSEYSD